MKLGLKENAANRKAIFGQIDKAMKEFLQEKAAADVDKERIEVSLVKSLVF